MNNKEVGKFTGNISRRPETRVTRVTNPDVVDAQYRYLDNPAQSGTEIKAPKQNIFDRKGAVIAAVIIAAGLGTIALANSCEKTPYFPTTPTTSYASGRPNPIENGNTCGYTWRHLNPGECTRVNAGDFFMGDGTVDGVFMTDSDENTGAIYVFERSAEVGAPYGGDIRTPINPNEKQRLIAEATGQMLNTGGVDHRGVRLVTVTTFCADGQNIPVPYGRK
jgi:hypothetical protein